MLNMHTVIVVLGLATLGVAVSVANGKQSSIVRRSVSANGNTYDEKKLSSVPSAQAGDMDALHSSRISEKCFNALESVDEELRKLLADSNQAFVAFDWVALLSPMREALEHLKDSAVESGIFQIKEFHAQMEKQGPVFGCHPAVKSAGSVGVKPDAMDQLRTLVDELGVCPKKILSVKTLSQLQDLVTLQTMVYQCVQSGSSPLNSTAERRRALQQDMLSSSLTVLGNSSQGSLYQLDTEQQELLDSHRSICESEHRLDYLDAIAPGSKRIFKDHGLCKGSTHMSQTQLVQTHEDIVEQMERVANALSNRKQGTMVKWSNPKPHKSLVAEHPMGQKRKGIWTKREGWDWSRRRWWGKRGKLQRRDSRKEWKAKQCPHASNPDFDTMFSTANGCSSPIPLLFKSSITPCCFVHDVCYSCVEGNSELKYKCDAAFKKDLKSECDRKVSWFSRWLCKTQADAMYLAVYIGGKATAKPDREWCKSPCATKYWNHTTHDALKITDPWYPGD